MISLFQLRIYTIFVIFECKSLIAYAVIWLPILTVGAVSMGFINFKSNRVIWKVNIKLHVKFTKVCRDNNEIPKINEILIMKSLRVSQLCVLTHPSQCYWTAWVYEIVMVNLANIFKMLNRIKLNSWRLLSIGASDIYIYIYIFNKFFWLR